MVCCSAVNCSNRSETGVKMYRFPSDCNRRKIWLLRMRRASPWIPSSTSRLCEKHFERSQFEHKRADGKMKLKPNAVPTLFHVPNPPPMINPPPRKSIYKKNVRKAETIVKANDGEASGLGNENNLHMEVDDEVTRLRQDNSALLQTLQAEREKIQKLVEEKEKLESQLNAMNETRKSFLTNDQIQLLEKGRVAHYDNETIIKGLKFRFALSVHGLEYLRSTGYPLPSYNTIMKRIQDLKLDFGIFKDVLELLAFKVQSMDLLDRYCIISSDEFMIASHLDHNKNLGKFVGHVTLGNDIDQQGEKIFLVVVRGAKNRWKQIIACHVTSHKSINPVMMKNFMLSCISEVEACGLVVIALSSDLDSRNRSFYTSVGITATREGIRRNSFTHNEHEIYTIPDPCHILKNLKSAMLRQIIYLPEFFVENENLPSINVNGSYVQHLWNIEITKELEKRFLHHLRAEDIAPNNFQKMNVGAAVRFFSPKTASALKTAVELKILPIDAISTARFILFVHEWFSIVSSQDRKMSITSRNCDSKYIFLHSVIDLFQQIIFQEGWKPLNYAFVIATLSFCDIAEFLFRSGYDFILGHRFTQDATENVISQIRSRAGQLPTAMKALSGIKLISVAQFVSDVKKNSYVNDADEFLLDFCKEKRNKTAEQFSSNIAPCIKPSALDGETTIQFQCQTFPVEHFYSNFTAHDANCCFYIAGSTTASVIKHICDTCKESMLSQNLPQSEFLDNAKKFTSFANQGGLKQPCFETLLLVFHCELFFNMYKAHILRNGYLDLVQEIIQKIDIAFLQCCNGCDVKYKVVKHFFVVRAFCVKTLLENSKKRKTVYATASAKKRKA